MCIRDSSEAASESAAASSARTLEDGTYTAEFDTDSSMFHVNEASDGKGTLLSLIHILQFLIADGKSTENSLDKK